MKNSLFHILLMTFAVMNLGAQDPVFSHFYAGGMHLNPALAGIEGPVKVFLGYRNQWPNSGSSYITYRASYDQFVEKLHGGLGFSVMNDRQGGGVFNNYQFSAMYAYQFRASRHLYLSGGIQAGMGQQAFTPGNMVFGNMIDPFTGNIGSSTETIPGYRQIYPDFATGIAAFYKKLYGGISVHHLLKPVVTEKNDPTGFIPRRYTLHVGALIPIYERQLGKELLQISPNFILIQQQSIQQINYGIEVLFHELIGGVWIRHDALFNYGSIILSTGYGSSSFRFRYSYDITLSSPALRLPNMGAHEFSLLILYENSGKRKKHGAIKCPKI